MVDRKREKLIHAMVFFITKTKHCYTLKLLKLLYFFDFQHFKETGRSVTGMEYFAWKMGPVPTSLYEEIKNRTKLNKFFNFIPEKFFDSEFKKENATRFVPKLKFDESLFSKREMRIMNHLIFLYKDVISKNMTEASHDKKSPWYKVFKTEKKPQQYIPYEYILNNSPESISKDFAKELANDDKAMEQTFDSVNTF